MTDLPDHVQAALAPKQRRRLDWESPWRPYRSADYRLPKGEWFFLYAPLAAVAALFVAGTGGQLGAIVASLWLAVCVLVPAAYRLPQEVRRAKERAWTQDPSTNAWRWSDPSGEWDYARWQSPLLSKVARWAVALAMPVLWLYALAHMDGNDTIYPLLWLPFATGALIYIHRHLPTTLQLARSVRRCGTCGKARPGYAVRQCPRCGRIAPETLLPALPALRRRLRCL